MVVGLEISYIINLSNDNKEMVVNEVEEDAHDSFPYGWTNEEDDGNNSNKADSGGIGYSVFN
jgi:hypothetical protein